MRNEVEKPARIAIGVGGRFHSDWMLESLLAVGHDTTLFTSIPRSRFPKFQSHIRSWLPPEIYFRLGRKFHLEQMGDKLKITRFGSYLERQLRAECIKAPWDLLISWSSFSLEAMQSCLAKRTILMRDSSHIQHQLKLLESEYQRFGISFPNRRFVVERELEEYRLADHLFVLSNFAKQSFIKQGTPPEKLSVLRLGVDTSRFKPHPHYVPARPLKMIYFGSLSLRKGIQYLLEATKSFGRHELALTLIGPVDNEFKSILSRFPHAIHHAQLPQALLAEKIRDQHVFVFPTLEDGFGQTLFQAMASGLVPITTEACGAGELLAPGKSGFIVESRSAVALSELISQIIKHPDQLSEMRQHSIWQAQQVSWATYARQLQSFVEEQIGARKNAISTSVSPILSSTELDVDSPF